MNTEPVRLLVLHTTVQQETGIVIIRDWSLITGRAGATKREGGGHVKFYPYEKKGVEKVLAMLKGGGGHKKF